MKITNRIPFTLADYESGKYRVVTESTYLIKDICVHLNLFGKIVFHTRETKNF